jgi:hypothetical protein
MVRERLPVATPQPEAEPAKAESRIGSKFEKASAEATAPYICAKLSFIGALLPAPVLRRTVPASNYAGTPCHIIEFARNFFAQGMLQWILLACLLSKTLKISAI